MYIYIYVEYVSVHYTCVHIYVCIYINTCIRRVCVYIYVYIYRLLPLEGVWLSRPRRGLHGPWARLGAESQQRLSHLDQGLPGLVSVTCRSRVGQWALHAIPWILQNNCSGAILESHTMLYPESEEVKGQKDK